MKLKYKKMIMLTAMSTMGIGLLTLAISQERPKAEEILNTDVHQESEMFGEDKDTDMELEKAMLAAPNAYNTRTIPSTAPEQTPELTPTVTPIPTPASLPIYALEDDSNYPEIKSLFVDYYTAKNNCDIDKLKTMLTVPENVDALDDLQTMTEYIDDYRNIKSYIKKSYIEDAYIVFVYHEIKFISVNTPAPGLSKFYVVKDGEGNYQVYSGLMDTALFEYYTIRNYDADIVDLIATTNSAGEKARAKDEDLAKFWSAMDELYQNAQDSASAAQ